jgi:hypothetical protein
MSASYLNKYHHAIMKGWYFIISVLRFLAAFDKNHFGEKC